MPFLVPPPDFTVRQLEEQGLTGTCEIQVTRSCGPWSMGTTDRVEHSIQNAYLKAIQLSEHFVYIENQFFITSTVVDGVEIENQIGDALVNRIIKAHEEGTAWRACIVIPLFPGYTYPIDSDQAASVRLIVECQNKSICRGPNSIFSRLRQEGIDPDDYISFFSLRGWGKFKSGVLTTEMVYIHGKTCIVDDRLVIIGSANINERSMRGDRDSELASIIRDTDMIDSTMAGKPYKVGRFAHTLRVRLMRGASPLVPWYALASRCLLTPLFQPRLQSTLASTLTQ
jgi:phospholipase D1/2